MTMVAWDNKWVCFPPPFRRSHIIDAAVFHLDILNVSIRHLPQIQKTTLPKGKRR